MKMFDIIMAIPIVVFAISAIVAAIKFLFTVAAVSSWSDITATIFCVWLAISIVWFILRVSALP